MALSPRYEGYAGYLLERMVLTLSNSDASVARDRGTCRPNMPPGDRSLNSVSCLRVRRSAALV